MRENWAWEGNHSTAPGGAGHDDVPTENSENSFCLLCYWGLVSNLRMQQFSRIRKLLEIPGQPSIWRKFLTSFL